MFFCLTKEQLANLRTCGSTAGCCACRRSHRCGATCGSSFAIITMDSYFNICGKLSCFCVLQRTGWLTCVSAGATADWCACRRPRRCGATCGSSHAAPDSRALCRCGSAGHETAPLDC